ncbi:unnamed protein product [Vitrella brassicaformis CCMP3155]|uniref:Uncharacterized protein n=2 Tax=Vitrella brassicaformis TaxID=1169539 RepID=A0A0G4GHP6_VITBC|nr:unnamed protein product [Vitrella brassicaformis CCMP3155]|eukprot:CEM29154.1 unnamed protein product [Vitrella brassicaformis CCMP3155]
MRVSNVRLAPPMLPRHGGPAYWLIRNGWRNHQHYVKKAMAKWWEYNGETSLSDWNAKPKKSLDPRLNLWFWQVDRGEWGGLGARAWTELMLWTAIPMCYATVVFRLWWRMRDNGKFMVFSKWRELEI